MRNNRGIISLADAKYHGSCVGQTKCEGMGAWSVNGVMKMVTFVTAVSVVAATGLVLASDAARRTAKGMANAVENAGHKMGQVIDKM